MMNTKLIQGSSIYLTANIFSRAIPFLLLPILTFYLSTEQYGKLGLFQALISFALPIAGLSLSTHITRNAATINSPNFPILLHNILRLLVKATGITLICVTVIVLVLESIHYNTPFSHILVLSIPIIAALLTLNTIILAIFRNSEQQSKYAISEIARSILYGLSVLLVLTQTSLNWKAVIVAQAISLTLIIIINSRHLCFNNPSVPNNNRTHSQKELLGISIPLIPHALATSTIFIADRFILDAYANTSSVGLYVFAYQLGAITSIIIDSMILAWSPWFYKQISDTRNHLKIVKLTYLASSVMFICSIIVGILCPLIAHEFFPPQYHDSTYLIPYISLACFAHGLYKLLLPYLVYTKNTKAIAFSTAIAAISNLVLNFMLIPTYGAIGAALSTIMAYFIAFVLIMGRAKKDHPMPWRLNV